MEEIHKGRRYTITTDGVMAQKSDSSGNVRRMKYYPERDISAIAGEIDELTAWLIMKDVAEEVVKSKTATPISPEHIFIEGGGFVLSQWSESSDERFIAPEGYCPVWALAATVFYVFLGCNVFQGLGGRGQSATAPIPTLRRELSSLSNLIIRCLDYNPSNRPEMSEIAQIAQENIQRCKTQQNQVPPLKKNSQNKISADEIDLCWPEEMC